MSYLFLQNYNAMPQKEFWALVKATGAPAKERFQLAWVQVAKGAVLSDKAAQKALNDLFVYSHQRILEKGLDKFYPTQQCYQLALSNVQDLWWVDHYTAGINAWSTVNWFSSRKNANGKFNGASTHFVQDYHGDPLYLVSLVNGAWHEPRKNKDSISIETVNAGKLHRNDKGNWAYWAGEVPLNLQNELPPTAVTPPYKGAEYLQPFTLDQIRNNILIKRLVKMALGERISPLRMSQHSDWREGKSDMGPLWPFAECNAGAFNEGMYPVEQLLVLQNYENSPISKPDKIDTHHTIVEENCDSPEYGVNIPTSNEDEPDAHKAVLSVVEAKQHLDKLGFTSQQSTTYDWAFKQAVEMFQAAWNHKKVDLDASAELVVDGILGPKTTKALLLASQQCDTDQLNWR
jgi:N-acetyl-anhydromuramyl-L-alanine amidase AmpD